MCDGNLRSTIKALIMANEFLEAELTELQAAISSGCAPLQTSHCGEAAPPDGARPWPIITYYVAMPFLQDDTGSLVAGAAEECQSPRHALAARRDAVAGRPAISAR